MCLGPLKKELRKYSREYKAKFLGVSVPNCRLVAKKYQGLSLKELEEILKTGCHEERLTALMILVDQFKNSPDKVFKFYLKNTKYINNWDLVDLSCYKIVGQYLLDRPREILYELAVSKNIWERRIAIVSTYTFIKSGQLEDTIKISKILLGDKHDLIHKAVGWMLRELGKKDEKLLVNFIKTHYSKFPRTTLRYAIERFSEKVRKNYLTGKF